MDNMKRRFEEREKNINVKRVRMETMLKAEIAKSRDPLKIPECPICSEEPSACKPYSSQDEVKGCPDGCKAGLMGRDHGMEASNTGP